MGMANKAPESRYVRKHNISHHALERFRERVEEDVKCRSNHDISNLLDEKICQATQVYTVRDPRAPEAITKLHAIELRSGTYYAVVREGTAVTVLDETMVKDNYSMENCIAYAQALKHKHECEQGLERVKDSVKQAEEVLQAAHDKLAEITQTLMDLATGKVQP